MAPTLWSTMAPAAVAMCVLLLAQGQENPGNEALLDRFQNTTDFGLRFEVGRQIAQAGHVEAQQMVAPEPGMWAWGAAYLWPGPTALADAPIGGRRIEVPSPDGRTVVVVRDSVLTVVASADRQRILGPPIEAQDLAEVLWAPDSRAFAITESDGGWVAQWSATIYVVDSTSVRRVASASQALADFSRRKVSRRDYGCTVEPPNMAVIDWNRGSERLLMVAEAPPHGTCCDLGRLAGYLVETATGRVLARYSQRDVERLFHRRLGIRFR